MERGWLGSAEINRVTYDTDKISKQELEARLKKAGTYIRTIPSDLANDSARKDDGKLE